MEKLRTMEDVAAIFKNNYENCQVLNCLRDLSALLSSLAFPSQGHATNPSSTGDCDLHGNVRRADVGDLSHA